LILAGRTAVCEYNSIGGTITQAHISDGAVLDLSKTSVGRTVSFVSAQSGARVLVGNARAVSFTNDPILVGAGTEVQSTYSVTIEQYK
jgi:hypothetical protein